MTTRAKLLVTGAVVFVAGFFLVVGYAFAATWTSHRIYGDAYFWGQTGTNEDDWVILDTEGWYDDYNECTLYAKRDRIEIRTDSGLVPGRAAVGVIRWSGKYDDTDLGSAYMIGSTGAGVECTSDGDVIITLGD